MFVVTKSDGLRPVVAPLDHGPRLEVVAPELVEVPLPALHRLTQRDLRPVTKTKATNLGPDSTTTLSITTFSIMVLFVTLSIKDCKHNDTRHKHKLSLC